MFEGVTSWLGDISCLRNGAWTEEVWRTEHEWMRERHLSDVGWMTQSLAESSHEAWSQLYMQQPLAREAQVSHHLEGQFAALCLPRERHLSDVGWMTQSLAESSHEAWSQLYMQQPLSREAQVSHHLEGQFAALCLPRERHLSDVGWMTQSLAESSHEAWSQLYMQQPLAREHRSRTTWRDSSRRCASMRNCAGGRVVKWDWSRWPVTCGSGTGWMGRGWSGWASTRWTSGARWVG